MLLPPPLTFPVFTVGLLAGAALTLLPVAYFWVTRELNDREDDLYCQITQNHDKLFKDIEDAEDRVFKMFENTSGHTRDAIEIPLATLENVVEDHTTQIADFQNNLNDLRLIVMDLQSQIVAVESGRVFKAPSEDAPIAPVTKRSRKNI